MCTAYSIHSITASTVHISSMIWGPYPYWIGKVIKYLWFHDATENIFRCFSLIDKAILIQFPKFHITVFVTFLK